MLILLFLINITPNLKELLRNISQYVRLNKKGRYIVMKKLSFALCALCCLAACSNASEEPTTDTFTSASVGYYYESAALTGDELWNAFENFQLAPTIATVNPDGSPNLAVFIPAVHTVVEDEEYFVMGLADNQTKLNLEKNKEGIVALYGGYGDEKGPLAGKGARLVFELVEDEDIITKVKASNEIITDQHMILHITEIKPLG